jgi:UPF0716 family protein affecting phage T7 exclusion
MLDVLGGFSASRASFISALKLGIPGLLTFRLTWLLLSPPFQQWNTVHKEFKTVRNTNTAQPFRILCKTLQALTGRLGPTTGDSPWTTSLGMPNAGK